jgi:hypothetical protein
MYPAPQTRSYENGVALFLSSPWLFSFLCVLSLIPPLPTCTRVCVCARTFMCTHIYICTRACMHVHACTCTCMYTCNMCMCMFYTRSVPTLSLVSLSFHFSPAVSLLFSSPLREFCIPQPPGMLYMYMLYACTCMHAALRAHMCTHGTALYSAVCIYSGGRGGHTVLHLHDAVHVYYDVRCQAARHCTALHCAVSVSV